MFIVWLLLLHKILDNMYVVIVCLPRCEVLNFEMNLIFLINMNKKSRQKYEDLQNKKSFKDELKSIFHHFKGILIEANEIIFFWKLRL